jgi:hypothetical protein
MRVAPDDPEKPIGFESQFFWQVVRQAGVPFTSSNFSDRKTRWVDFGKAGSGGGRSGIECRVTGRQRPRGARQLVRQGAGHHVRVSARQHRADPVCQTARLRIEPLHVRSCALDQQSAQVLVASLADPQQVGLAAGAVLARYQPDRRGEVPAAAVLLAIAHFGG